MVVLIVIIGVLLLILYAPIFILVDIDRGLMVKLYLFFIPITIYPLKEKKDKPKKVNKEKKPKPEPPKPEQAVDEEPKDKADTKQMIFKILKVVGSSNYRPILRSITITKLCLMMNVFGNDAADTAKKYGLIQTALQNAIEYLSLVIRIKNRDIRIIPAFFEMERVFVLKLRIRTYLAATLFVVIGVAIRTLKVVLSSRNKKEQRV